MNGIGDYDDLFLGISDQEALLQKLNQLQGCTESNPISLANYQMNPNESALRIAEILKILQKNKQTIPDICCLHCPKLRRLIMKNSKLLDEFLKCKNDDTEHKHHVRYEVILVYEKF